MDSHRREASGLFGEQYWRSRFELLKLDVEYFKLLSHAGYFASQFLNLVRLFILLVVSFRIFTFNFILIAMILLHPVVFAVLFIVLCLVSWSRIFEGVSIVQPQPQPNML